MSIRFTIKLNNLEVAIFLDKRVGVLVKQRGDLRQHVVRLGQCDGLVPLVQANAGLHRHLHESGLEIERQTLQR